MKLPKLKLPAFLGRLAPSRETLRKSWTRWLGYPAFFAVAFWLALFATFPNDALRDRIAAEARNRLATEVQIGSVHLAGLTGITLRDVSWVADDSLPEPAQAVPTGEGEKAGETVDAVQQAPAPSGRIVLDKVTAKAEVLALLRGEQAFTFDVAAWGGNVEGRYAAGDGLDVRAELRDVDLARSPLRPLAGVDLAGKLARVDLELTSNNRDLSKASGKFVVRGDGLHLKGGEVQGIELPEMALGTLEGNVTIENGKATFEDFALKGPDVEAELEGYVRLNTKVGFSTLSGKLKLKPSDEWWNKNEMLKGMANFALPAGKDGWRTVGLYGQLSKPNFRPQR